MSQTPPRAASVPHAPRRSRLRWLWRCLHLSRAFGVPVQMHTTTLLYPTGLIVGLAVLDGWEMDYPGARWTLFLRTLLLLDVFFLSLLIHEFAHVLVARRCGVGTTRVVLLPIGAVALLDAPLRNTRELWIAIAGPVASLVLAGVCWLAAEWLGALHVRDPFLRAARVALDFGCFWNAILAGFNLLPCFPMDGGRVLRSLLAMALRPCTRTSPEQAFATATSIVVLVVNPLVAVGAMIFTVMHSHAWLHLLLFPLLLIAGYLERLVLLEGAADPA